MYFFHIGISKPAYLIIEKMCGRDGEWNQRDIGGVRKAMINAVKLENSVII